MKKVTPQKPLDNGSGSGIIKNIKLPTEKNSIAGMSPELSSEINNSFKRIQSEYTKCGSQLFTEENRTKMFHHERILSGNKYETAIVYNSDGSIKFKKKGNNDSVTFTAAERQRMNGCVVTHNHPNGSVQSPEDIMMIRRANLTEIRACNSKGAYVVTAPAKWSDEIDTLGKIREKYFDYYEGAMSKYKDIAAQEGKPLIYYLRKADEDGLKDFCLHYGLGFRWEEK